MWPFTLLTRWYRKRQRNIDRALLFPAIRAQQKTWEAGSAAIWRHIEMDEAWSVPSEWQTEPIELEDTP